MTQQTIELISYCVRSTARELVKLLDQKNQQPSGNQLEFLGACKQLLKKLNGN
jgi:hypothetical protein